MNIDTLREAFGDEAFSTRDAAVALAVSPAAARTLLGDLRLRGLLVRVERGRYQVAPQPRRAALERRRIGLRLERALATPLRIGLDGPDAVAAWTRGRYQVSQRPGALHVAVAADDEAAYRRHLEDVGLPVGEGRGAHVMLRVVPEPCFTDLDGVPVLDHDAVLEVIHDHPIAYEGAEEWLSVSRAPSNDTPPATSRTMKSESRIT